MKLALTLAAGVFAATAFAAPAEAQHYRHHSGVHVRIGIGGGYHRGWHGGYGWHRGYGWHHPHCRSTWWHHRLVRRCW